MYAESLPTIYLKLNVKFTFYSKRKYSFHFPKKNRPAILNFTSNAETLLHFTSKQISKITLTLKYIYNVFRQVMDEILNIREIKWGIYDLTKITLLYTPKSTCDVMYKKPISMLIYDFNFEVCASNFKPTVIIWLDSRTLCCIIIFQTLIKRHWLCSAVGLFLKSWL